MPVDQAQALINSAGGDFVATLTAVLALFIMGVFAYFIRWVMQMIPDQMQRDRNVITTQMASDRAAVCEKLGEMIVELRDVKCSLSDDIKESEKVRKEWLDKHDEQAKHIDQTCNRIETTLAARPCIKKLE